VRAFKRKYYTNCWAPLQPLSVPYIKPGVHFTTEDVNVLIRGEVEIPDHLRSQDAVKTRDKAAGAHNQAGWSACHETCHRTYAAQQAGVTKGGDITLADKGHDKEIDDGIFRIELLQSCVGMISVRR